jgi:hypothetical protein
MLNTMAAGLPTYSATSVSSSLCSFVVPLVSGVAHELVLKLSKADSTSVRHVDRQSSAKPR